MLYSVFYDDYWHIGNCYFRIVLSLFISSDYFYSSNAEYNGSEVQISVCVWASGMLQTFRIEFVWLQIWYMEKNWNSVCFTAVRVLPSLSHTHFTLDYSVNTFTFKIIAILRMPALHSDVALNEMELSIQLLCTVYM